MLVFPQLVTGGSGIYPVKKTSTQRTVLNTLGDGRTDVYSDPDAATTMWQIPVKGLTTAEWNAIQSLFQATSGMWQAFTFLDPVGNLIIASENFAESAWANGPLIHLTNGVSDPLGTTRATTVVNTGQAVQAVSQTLNVPGNFHYCLSAWARTNSGSAVTFSISTTGGSATKTFSLSTQWSRLVVSANLNQGTDGVTFGAQLAAGATIDLFGIQVEAQLGASDYKMTVASAGVYPNARFADDAITVTAQGTDINDSVIRIVSMGN